MKTYLPIVGISVVMTLLLGVAGAAPATPVIEFVASADGVPIRYETVGKTDAALVLVHCWTCNRNFWDAQVAYFAPRLQVVRLDLAGHGESGKARKRYTIPAFAGDVVAVVDKLGLKRVVLVGHSMGGPVALEAQKLLGDRVIGVVGVDTFYTGFKIPEDKKKSDEFMKPFEDDYAETGKKFVRTMFAPSTDPAIVENISKSMAAADKDMAISALRSTHVWFQTDSQAAYKRVGARLRNINGDPKGGNKPLHESVVLIAGAAHFPAQEQPAAFNQALERFVTQFVGAAPTK